MERLQKIAEEFKTKHRRELMCSLIFDEIHVRQQVLFSLQQMNYIGYADYGQASENGQKNMAKQAIVFFSFKRHRS